MAHSKTSVNHRSMRRKEKIHPEEEKEENYSAVGSRNGLNEDQMMSERTVSSEEQDPELCDQWLHACSRGQSTKKKDSMYFLERNKIILDQLPKNLQRALLSKTSELKVPFISMIQPLLFTFAHWCGSFSAVEFWIHECRLTGTWRAF